MHIPEIDLSHPGWWALGWAVLSAMISGVVAAYVWVSSRAAASVAHVDAIGREMDRRLSAAAAEHDPMRVAIARLDEAVRQAPDHGDIQRVNERIDRLTEATAEIRGGIRRIENAVDLMHSHLLGGKARV